MDWMDVLDFYQQSNTKIFCLCCWHYQGDWMDWQCFGDWPVTRNAKLSDWQGLPWHLLALIFTCVFHPLSARAMSANQFPKLQMSHAGGIPNKVWPSTLGRVIAGPNRGPLLISHTVCGDEIWKGRGYSDNSRQWLVSFLFLSPKRQVHVIFLSIPFFLKKAT